MPFSLEELDAKIRKRKEDEAAVKSRFRKLFMSPERKQHFSTMEVAEALEMLPNRVSADKKHGLIIPDDKHTTLKKRSVYTREAVIAYAKNIIKREEKGKNTFSLENALDYLSISRHQLKNFIKEGLIAFEMKGNAYLFYKKDLDKFIEDHLGNQHAKL